MLFPLPVRFHLSLPTEKQYKEICFQFYCEICPCLVWEMGIALLFVFCLPAHSCDLKVVSIDDKKIMQNPH